MSALESLDGYLKELERKMRLAAWTRGVAVAAFCALIATLLLVTYTNSTAFAERDVLVGRFVLFLVLALAVTFGIVLPLIVAGMDAISALIHSSFGYGQSDVAVGWSQPASS